MIKNEVWGGGGTSNQLNTRTHACENVIWIIATARLQISQRVLQIAVIYTILVTDKYNSMHALNFFPIIVIPGTGTCSWGSG